MNLSLRKEKAHEEQEHKKRRPQQQRAPLPRSFGRIDKTLGLPTVLVHRQWNLTNCTQCYTCRERSNLWESLKEKLQSSRVDRAAWRWRPLSGSLKRVLTFSSRAVSRRRWM